MPQLTLAAAPNTTNLSENLQLWSTGDAVRALQQFLNVQGFIVAQSGPGSPGEETTVFGTHTYQALLQFQAARGLPATGFFGPLTRAAANSLAISGDRSSSAASVISNAIPTATGATTTPPLEATATQATATTSPKTIPFYPVSGMVPGNGYTPGFGGGGGAPVPAPAPTPPPAPAPYVANAVHFDGANFLARAFNTNLASFPGDPLFPNTTTGTISVWLKTGSSVTWPDPATFMTAFWTYGAIQGASSLPDLGNPQAQLGVGYSIPDTNNNLDLGFEMYPGLGLGIISKQNSVLPNTWYHFAASWNTNIATGQKQYQLYLNGTDQLDSAESAVQDSTAGASPVQWSYYDSGSAGTVFLSFLPEESDRAAERRTRHREFSCFRLYRLAKFCG
jgi:peptidoglycan hydrolase-like protein with peptidoglycan-binding domain